MKRYRSQLGFQSQPGVVKQYDLTLRMDLPSLVKDCKSSNNFFHHKMEYVQEITERIRKQFTCKGFGIEWIDARPETSERNYDFMAVHIRIKMDYAKKRKRFFELINKICSSLETWENKLQNYNARRKHIEEPYPDPTDINEITQFKYERLPFEVDDIPEKEKIEPPKPKTGEQFSLNLENKDYCISLKDYMKQNK